MIKTSVKPSLEILENRCSPAVINFFVNNAGDAGSGINNMGDLRYCIQQAKKKSATNTCEIGVPNGLNITLGAPLPMLTGSITINGNSTINANGVARVFNVAQGARVQLGSLTLEGGREQNGGGIYNSGSLRLNNNIKITGNSASNWGGGIYNGSNGVLTISGATVSYNTAVNDGGGIANFHGKVTITGSSNNVTDNKTTSSSSCGGGIWNNTGSLTFGINPVQIANNTAVLEGGGIYSDDGTISSCQDMGNILVYGNSAESGGGLYSSCNLNYLYWFDFESNYAGSSGGGIYLTGQAGGVGGTPSMTYFGNTTVNGNVAGVSNNGLFQGPNSNLPNGLTGLTDNDD